MANNAEWIHPSGTGLWTDEALAGADRAHEALGRAAARAWDELRAYYLRRQTRRVLERLSDRALADIGVSRDELGPQDERVRGWSWVPAWRA